MNRIGLLLIFIHWYLFRLVKSSTSFFDFDENVFQAPYFVNENFSIGANFNLPSSYKCVDSQCLINLKLALRSDNHLLMNLWCDLSATLITTKYKNMKELSCVWNGISANAANYHLSATAQVHTAGSLIPVFSAIFPNDPGANQEWVRREIFVLDSSTNEQQLVKRNRRQDMNTDGIVNSDNLDPIQTMTVNDETNINQPIQLNDYTGNLNQGFTVDVTCDGTNSCPNYPQTDDQGRTICCFLLPQATDCNTALSSVVYQSGAQNLNDFQVNIGPGQSFTASNDLSVFLGAVITASQCLVVLPVETTQSNSAQFRITWTYQSNAADGNSAPSLPPITAMTDGTLPVNVLRVTSSAALVRQTPQYTEWFVCPTSQDDQISILQSIAILMGTNVDYFRCIYVNNQGIPLKDPTTGQLLVFTSTKDDLTDNPTIVSLPAFHTDCLSIQFFPTPSTSVDVGSILLGITIAYQTAAPTTDMSAVMPQASDLQGTAQIEIDIAINISPSDNNNNIDNTAQIYSPVAIVNNPSNDSLMQCTRYQADVPMSSYDSSIGKYTGTFDIPSQTSQPTIIDSINVVGSSTIQNPITMVLIDSQGNTLFPPYSLTCGSIFEDAPNVSISRIILQAVPLQDAAMDSTLHADIVICPESTALNAPPPPTINFVMPSPQANILPDTSNPNGAGSPVIPIVVPVSQNPPPIQLPQPSSSVPPAASPDCQEKESSTLGTYPPDLSASTIPTMRSPSMSRPSASYPSFTVQKLPDHTCFDQISSVDNPFIYDIFISNSDYTSSLDCLFPASGCSINFTRTKLPKITLLFTAPACLSYFRVPVPSNVQRFSFSMYNENGTQIQLPETTDGRGTLFSSSDASPLVQFNQYLCGYGIIMQILATSDGRPPTALTIDTGGCFRNLSAMTTIMAPSPIQVIVSSSQFQQIPSYIPDPSNLQPAVIVPTAPLYPSPASWSRVPATSMMMPPPPPPQQPPPSSPVSPAIPLLIPLSCVNGYQLTTLLFGNPCLSEVVTNDPSVIPDYTINPGYQGVNFQSNFPITITYQFNCVVYLKYICIIGESTNVNKFSYLILDINEQNIGQGIVDRLTPDQCTPRPLPTAELAYKVNITIEGTIDGQPPRNVMIDIQGCFLLSTPPAPVQPPPAPSISAQIQYFQPAPSVIPSAPSSSSNIRMSPTPSLSPLPVPSPPPSSIPIAPQPVPPQTMLPVLTIQPFVPAFQRPPPAKFPPSRTPIPASLIQSPPPSPIPSPSQTVPSVGSIFSPVIKTPVQPPVSLSVQFQPISPSQQYPPQTPVQPLPSPITPNTTPQPLAPLVCSNNGQVMPLTFGSPCVSRIVTSDPTVLVDYKINPGAQGINFQSNPPVTITIQFNCNIQIMYMCIPGSITNAASFSYTLKDAYNNSVASGSIRSQGLDQCTPRPLNITNPATQLIITISQTFDGQPPYRVVLDLQGCYISTIPVISTQQPVAAVTPSSPFVAPAPAPFVMQPPVPSQLTPISVPIQAVPPSQQTPSTPLDQATTTTTSGPVIPSNTCPQVSLTSHPSVAFIVFSDGTNVTSGLDSDGNGCNLVSTGATMTVILRDGAPATFSSVGITSPNVNQIDVALFDELSNRPLIQSPQGTMRSPLTLNPTVQNLPANPAATLVVTFLSTIDGQPPRNVKLQVYACFPTVTEISPSPTATIPSQPPVPSQYPSNTFLQQVYYPVSPPVQTYPYIQPYPSPLSGPTNICIDLTRPAQVTSIGNTPLPVAYYSTNQCVCICHPGIVIPTSSGMIQYYQTRNKRTVTDQVHQKQQTILTKSNN